MDDSNIKKPVIKDIELYENWLKIAISDLNCLKSTIQATRLNIYIFKEKNPSISNHLLQMLESTLPLLQEKYEDHLEILFKISKEPNVPHNVDLMKLAINQYR
jgi:hypothetical protein